MKRSKDLIKENQELKRRLSEAEELLAAIKSGAVDALITDDQKVYTLKGADLAYRIFVDTMSEGAATLTFDGTVMYCNKRLAKMFKVSSEEITGNSIFKFIHPDALGNLKRLLKQGCSSSSSRGNIVFLDQDGKKLSVNVACNPLRLGPKLVCAVFTDVSKLKEAQVALEKSNLELKSKVKERTVALRSANDELNAGNQELVAINEELANANEKLRQETEERRKSGELFRVLFTESTVGQGLADPETRRIVQVNKAFCRMMGYSRKEMLRRTFLDLLHPDDRKPVIAAYEAMLRGKIPGYHKEKRYLRADGSVIWVDVFTNLIRDQAGQPFRSFAMVQDITARKQAEEAAAAAQGQVRSIIENTTSIVYVFDLEERFLMVNRGTAKLLNSTPEQIIGKRRYEFMPKDDADWHEANDRQVIKAGKALQFEEHSQLEGRSITWFTTKFPLRDAQGRIYAVAGISTDVSERKQAEEALRESEAKYRNLFENMTEEVHFWKVVRDGKGQIKTWRLVDANPPTLKSWGKGTIEEIRGKTTDEIFGPGSTEHYRAVLEKIMAEGLPYSFEDYFPQLGKYFRFTSVPLGEYFINTGADITDIKNNEQLLRASEEHLRASNDELRRFNRVMVDREMRVIELKKQINELNEKAGKPAPYNLGLKEK